MDGNMTEYLSRHKRISDGSIKVDIGTFNRKDLRSIYINVLIGVGYYNEEGEEFVQQLKERCDARFKDWLNSQDMWDRKNKLVIWEHPENSNYVSTAKSIVVQYYLTRHTVNEWKETVKGITPLVDTIIHTIKSTCDDNGINMKRREGKNRRADKG